MLNREKEKNPNPNPPAELDEDVVHPLPHEALEAERRAL